MSLLADLSNRVTGHAVAQGAQVQPFTGRVQPVAQGAQVIGPDFLRHMLDAQDRTGEVARKGQEGLIHVSSLIGFCARQHALLRLYNNGQNVMRSASGGDRVVWALGRAAEHHVRKQIIATRRQDVFGIWVCACGETQHTGFFPDDHSCPVCRKRLETYNELPLIDEEAGIVGNPDILFRVNGAFLVVEIKSIKMKGADGWEGLEAPKGDHIFQGGHYGRMLLRQGYPVHRAARVLYVAKDYTFKSPYKEFEFDLMEPGLDRQIEDSRQWAMAAHAAVREGRLPARMACTSPDSAMAKKCSTLGPCFNRD